MRVDKAEYAAKYASHDDDFIGYTLRGHLLYATGASLDIPGYDQQYGYCREWLDKADALLALLESRKAEASDAS